MPLKFSANVSMIFTEEKDLLQRYRSAKQVGFKGVECVFPYDVPTEKLSAVRKELGIEQTLINTYMGNRQKKEMGFAAIPGKEKEFQDSLELSIKYCKALGCKCLHIMSGKIPDHEESQKADLLKQMEDTYIKNLTDAVPRLEKEGILALIEPMNTKISFPNYFMNTIDLAVRVIDKVGHRNLKLQFDFFHVQIMHGNLTKNFKDNFKHVGYIQVSQPPHRGEPDSGGEIDYNYIFAFLEEMGYNGWIGAEYTPTGKSEDSFKWFDKFKV
ncbi:putative hydroxypyruvate isomerase [Apostichopus japonicus]|uniref:Putative hydroxypyruvate isomerase n=1 Tax=Stichopus japonicus TaxID=307972 RepID=A0A2G8JYI4_STIJA|nr:putative hydroxypyruvate isomerase [Apostichopus japonicus]